MLRRTSLAACVAAVVVAVAFGTPVAAQAGRFITGGDIKDGSVTTADVANGSLKKKDFAAGALPEDGAKGPKGDQGAEGLAGDQGPSGVVDTVFRTGSVYAPTPTLAFIAPTARASVGSGQGIFVVSAAALGAGVGTNGARGLDLDVCYQEMTGVIERVGVQVTGLSAAASHVQLFTLSAVADDLTAGVYDIGLCGSTSDAADWSLAGGGQTNVQVFTTP